MILTEEMIKALPVITENESKLFTDDYSNITFDSALPAIFGDAKEDIDEYIKVGREFWHNDCGKWRKLIVVYIRSGVMFFKYKDEPDIERAWFIGSPNARSLSAAQIYPYEIATALSKTYPDNNFLEICKKCKWDAYDGKINVEVIW